MPAPDFAFVLSARTLFVDTHHCCLNPDNVRRLNHAMDGKALTRQIIKFSAKLSAIP